MKQYDDYSEEGKRKAVEEVRAENERKRKERMAQWNAGLKEERDALIASIEKRNRRQRWIFRGAALVAMVGIAFGVKDCADHQAFLSNHCQVVQIRDGKLTSGFGSGFTAGGSAVGGSIIGYESGETVYKCDDGITRIE